MRTSENLDFEWAYLLQQIKLEEDDGISGLKRYLVDSSYELHYTSTVSKTKDEFIYGVQTLTVWVENIVMLAGYLSPYMPQSFTFISYRSVVIDIKVGDTLEYTKNRYGGSFVINGKDLDQRVQT